jgi:UDP-glucose 4-epimerase
MRVLVTGGLGVNGVWVLRQLIEDGHQVTLLDTNPDFGVAKDLADSLEFHLVDVTDLDRVTAAIGAAAPDCVAHLAAVMPDTVVANPVRGFTVNTTGTLNVLEACRLHQVPRIVVAGSRAAYGESTGKYATGSYAPAPEDMPPFRPNAYGWTKIASEVVVQWYREIFSMSVACLRFSSIYGPGRDARHGVFSLLSGLIESAYRRESVHVPDGGDQCSDYLYVEDVARGMMAAITAEKLDYPIYNISTGHKTSLREFADTINEVAGDNFITVGPGLDYYHSGKDIYGVLDNTRARESLGFTPAYAVRGGIQRYMSYLGSHAA